MKTNLKVFVKAMLFIAVMCIPVLQAAAFNYVDALSKSIMYYEASWCGSDAASNRLNWRGPCHTTDGADVGLDLTGGFHDAGDHVKFGLPQGYSATVLAWTLYQYKSVLTTTGQYSYLYTIVKHFTDYFIKCHPDANTFYYQIGDGDTDHSYWGPPELQKTSRPSYGVGTPTKPASDMAGDASATLAMMYLICKDTNPTYANTCLAASKTLYTFAKTYLGCGTGQTYYMSRSYWDELTWAAIWQYYATGTAAYLADMKSFITSMFGATGLANYSNNWTMCWDDVWAAIAIEMLRMERVNGITDFASYNMKAVVETNINVWMYSLTKSPGGLRILDTWGTLRYASAEAAVILMYYGIDSTTTTFRDFAKSQIDYVLGANPRNSSYLVGYGVNYPKFPHHRAASGRLESPPAYEHKTDPERHIIYGALVGGPDSSDAYVDNIDAYASTEVACDYNAGLVCALAGMSQIYGAGQTAEAVPVEPANTPYYIEANYSGIETSSEDKILISVCVETIHPPKFETQVSCRYFFNLSEVIAKGYSISDVTTRCDLNTSNATKSAITAWDAANYIYYVEISWAGVELYWKSQYMLVLECYTYSALDATNDYSHTGLTGTLALTNYIPMYIAGVKVAGNEPPKGGQTATATTITRTATATTVTRTATATTVTRTATATTIAGTPTRTATTITRTATATRTSTTVTRTATATRTSTTVTRTATATTVTRTATATTVTRTATSAVTPTTGTGCTCDAGCSTLTVIAPNFTKEGAGQFCYQAASLGSYINSWNLTTLEVNGVDFTNKWTAAASLPAKIDGLYYVYYNSTVAYGHFEALN